MPDAPNPTHPTRGLRAHTLRARAVCAATALAATLAACTPAGPPSRTPAPAARAAAPAPGPAPREQRGATLTRALEPLLPGGSTRLAVAVLDLDSADQEIASYAANEPFETASISKLGILAALLLQAQDDKRTLTAAERDNAEGMIRTSDNDAASTLWQTIGKAQGLNTAHKRLGLSSTHGGPGNHWGLTRTTATDQIQLLRAIFSPKPPATRTPHALTPQSRTYIQHLMTRITPDQNWGISAAASPGSHWALKNGWLQRTTTNHWIINTTGQITVHGHHYLLTILSNGHTTMKNGITLIEHTAKAAIGAATTHTHPWPHQPTRHNTA
jgi:beta-lactamase class A